MQTESKESETNQLTVGSKTIEIRGGNAMSSVFFTEDGKEVLGGGYDGTVRRWRTDDGREVGKAIQVDKYFAIFAAALSPDGKWLVCGLEDEGSNLRVWNVETHEQALDVRDGHVYAVDAVDVSPDSTRFASGSRDRRAFVWNIFTGERLAELLGHGDSWITSVRFSPSGDRIATTDEENIRIFDGHTGQLLLAIPYLFQPCVSLRLAWSADDRRLYTTSYSHASCFDMSSGSLVNEWFIPGDGSESPSPIALSRNQKFVAVTADNMLSIWNTSTYEQIGTAIEYESQIFCMALSPNCECIAISYGNGKITLRNLRGFLPDSCFTMNFPLVDISDVMFEPWIRGDLTRVEQLLTEEIMHPENPSRHACALAHRALVKTRLKQHDKAADDAKKSIEVHRSVIGHVAHAVACMGDGTQDSAMRAFDLAFTDGLSGDNNNFLLSIKAIILFECGKHDDATSRIDDLIDIVADKSTYIAVRARMLLVLGGMSLRKGDHKRAAELLVRAREGIPCQKGPHLAVISLIFGWDFDGIALTLQQHLKECVKPLEELGDAAMQSGNFTEASTWYSTALSLNPPSPAGLFVKRSKIQGMLMLWEEALNDADEAITADPQSPWGYERRYAALHALQCYDEAFKILRELLSLLEKSVDQDNRLYNGEGDAALNRLVEVVAGSDEDAILSWTGKCSTYNSCFPGSVAVRSRTQQGFSIHDDAQMDDRIAALRTSLYATDAMLIHARISCLPPARFANRRLYLPCVVFPVKKLVVKGVGVDQEKNYRARVSGIGHMEFQTADVLAVKEPRKLILVHPWISRLRDPLDRSDWGSGSGSGSDSDESVSDSGSGGAETAPLSLSASVPGPTLATDAVPLPAEPQVLTIDDHTRALRLVVRLQQPFYALLLQRQPDGGYRRVAAEREVLVPGLDHQINFARDVRTEVLEIV